MGGGFQHPRPCQQPVKRHGRKEQAISSDTAEVKGKLAKTTDADFKRMFQEELRFSSRHSVSRHVFGAISDTRYQELNVVSNREWPLYCFKLIRSKESAHSAELDNA